MRALLILLLLAGCATTIPGETVTVKIPVLVKCEQTIPVPPIFAVDLLPLGSDIWRQMSALREERHQHKAYEAMLIESLEACIK